MSETQEMYTAIALHDLCRNDAVALDRDISAPPNYSAQKRRLIAVLEEWMALGYDEFVLHVGAGDWTLSPAGPERMIRR
jgi:hypothetical protein